MSEIKQMKRGVIQFTYEDICTICELDLGQRVSYIDRRGETLTGRVVEVCSDGYAEKMFGILWDDTATVGVMKRSELRARGITN